MTGTGLRIVLLYATAGCATHMTAVRPLPPEKEAEINDIVSDRVAVVTLAGTPGAVTKNVRLDGSTVRFRQGVQLGTVKADWLPETQVPIASMQRIELRDHGRGALLGLGIGAGIGAVLGTIGGVIYGGICEGPNNDCAGKYGALGAAIGTVGLGLVGAGIGAAIGAPTIIEFQDASSSH